MEFIIRKLLLEPELITALLFNNQTVELSNSVVIAKPNKAINQNPHFDYFSGFARVDSLFIASRLRSGFPKGMFGYLEL